MIDPAVLAATVASDLVALGVTTTGSRFARDGQLVDLPTVAALPDPSSTTAPPVSASATTTPHSTR